MTSNERGGRLKRVRQDEASVSPIDEEEKTQPDLKRKKNDRSAASKPKATIGALVNQASKDRLVYAKAIKDEGQFKFKFSCCSSFLQDADFHPFY